MHDIPVLLITYNRPLHTAQVLEALRKHDIQNIYIFSDFPKTEYDVKGVSDTRKLFKEINWTTPTVICQNENIGLANSIINAANHVFRRCDRLILLEDDCVPQQYFFTYMADCLKRYEDNDKIFGISGYTIPIPEKILAHYPYDNYFFPRICSWGWATWKRAWSHHENNLTKLYDMSLERRVDLNQGGSDIPAYIKSMIEGDLKDVWTLSWQLTVYLQGGCYVHPTRSHIVNIGMDDSGIHCITSDKFMSNSANAKPSKFAGEIFYNKGIVNTFRNFYDVPETGNKFKLMIYHIRSLFRNLAAKLPINELI